MSVLGVAFRQLKTNLFQRFLELVLKIDFCILNVKNAQILIVQVH